MREFADEMTVLSGWLGHDLPAEHAGGLPAWTAFRFRDAVVFQPDEADRPQRMFLVRGDAVREFVISQGTIDEVYAELAGGPLVAAA